MSEPVCRLLRTKGQQPLTAGEETSTATSWCLATMESAGPDGDFVHPHVCHERRTCWQRSVECGGSASAFQMV